MDAVQQILAMLASAAGVLGVVVGFLQYKVSRQQAAAPVGPAPGSPDWAAGPTSAAVSHEPPGVVRAVAGWAVLDALISVGLLFGLLTVIVAHLDGFGFDVPELPAGIDVTGVVVLTALIGAAKVPAAIRRGAGLRTGDGAVRTKLLGMAAVDLFFSVIMAAVALWGSEVWSIPDPVLSMVGAYIVFGIVGSFAYLSLLLHRDTRAWVEQNQLPVGR